MKYWALLYLTIFSWEYSVAQQDTIFFDKKWNQTIREKSEYFRIETPLPTELELVQVEDYYSTGQIQMRGYFSHSRSEIKQGHFVFYYKNGNKSSEGNFEKNQCVGVWTYWYENGVKKELRSYKLPEAGQYRMASGRTIHLWDSTGFQLVKNGTGSYEQTYVEQGFKTKGELVGSKKEGEWIGEYIDGGLYFKEKYQNDELISGVSYDSLGHEYHYNELDVQPEPIGGIYKFYQYISKHLKYPMAARRSNIQGKVFVQFFIDENGKTVDFEVVKGIGGGCDEAAIKAFEGSPDWTPGVQRGQRVRVKMIMPINFSF